MLGVDPEFGTSALRLWVAAGSAALLFLFCMLALFRPLPSLSWRAGLVILSAIFGAAIAGSRLVACLPRCCGGRECRSGLRESAFRFAGQRRVGILLCCRATDVA